MADVDALGGAQLFASPQVSDQQYYLNERLRNAAAQQANNDVSARQRAGQLFAQGDYAGAAAALAPADMKGAEALQDRTSLQGAAAAANRGDPNAAGAQAAQTGDLAQVQAARGQGAQVGAQQLAGLQLMARQLASVPAAPGDAQNAPDTPRAQALTRLAQSGIYSQYGLTPDLIAKAYANSPGDLADDHLKLVLGAQLPFSGTLKEGDVAYANGQPVAYGGDKPVVLSPGQEAVSNRGPVIAHLDPLLEKTGPGDLLKSPVTGAVAGGQTPFETKPVTYTSDQNVLPFNGTPGAGTPSPASAATSPASGNGGHNGPGGGALSADQVFANMVQRESGGRPGVPGPQTAYGVAHGSTQMLDSTAQSMAQKLGVPWRPDLMRGTSPEAAQYQQTLGRAYFDEGLAKGHGDPAYAAAYYQGGPNPAIHGAQNAAYVHAVTGSGVGPTGAPVPGQAGLLHAASPSVVQNANGTQTNAKGEVSAQPNFLTPVQRMDAIGKFAELPQVKEYEAAADALNTLHQAMPRMKNINGVIGAAAFGAQVRGVSGGVERPATVRIMTEQLPLDQEIKAELQNKFGGESKVTPELFNQIEAYITSSAIAKQRGAQRALTAYEGQVPRGQQPIGLSLSPISARPNVPWINPNAGVNPAGPPQSGAAPRQAGPPVRLQGGGAAARAQYATLPSGAQFIAPDGSVRIKR